MFIAGWCALTDTMWRREKIRMEEDMINGFLNCGWSWGFGRKAVQAIPRIIKLALRHPGSQKENELSGKRKSSRSCQSDQAPNQALLGPRYRVHPIRVMCQSHRSLFSRTLAIWWRKGGSAPRKEAYRKQSYQAVCSLAGRTATWKSLLTRDIPCRDSAPYARVSLGAWFL